MFDFIRKHTRVLFFFLIVLIIPSFVFFGLQGYTTMDGDHAKVVARVGDIEITQAELDAAHRQQIERIRQQAPDIDTRMLDTPEMRQETLDRLVRERLLVVAADKMHLVTTDERMLRQFRNDPQFAFMRNPDGSINPDILAAQGMSSELFAQRLRQDISARQVLDGVEATVLAPAAAASAALDAFLQQREIELQRFEPAEFEAKVKPSEAEIAAYYKEHATRFQAAEQVDINYVVLDAAKLQQAISIDEEELRKYYAQNEARYSTPEERRASHILIKAEQSASADERKAAKAKADALLVEARKNPDGFAELAKKNSDDPGSAANGGDLDFFGKGAMVKPFEDAAFTLKKDEISDVISSDFGFHIIKLTGVRGGDKRSFEAVRPEIETLLRQQLAQQKYSELAAEFSNVVYEQADSLQPAADKFKLELQTAKGLSRNPAPGATGPLASTKLLDAIFSNDALRNKRNTDAVEIAATQMVAAHVTNYAPAHTRPLAEVRDQVVAALVTEQAAALARKQGEARLAELKAAPGTVIDKPLTISRAQARDLSSKIIDAALRAPSGTLPAIVGVDLGLQGYAVIKVNKVLGRDPAAGDAVSARTQYAKALGDLESQAYYESLKRRYEVEFKLPAASAASAPAN